MIVCDERKQIGLILSLYALSSDQEMPSNDEMLICTNKTTGEEVESFLRLVLTTPMKDSCLYCIANIQELTYEAQVIIEKYLHHDERFNKPLNTGKFALVFVSTTVKSSIIASVLAKYRVTPVELNDNDLRDYVEKKLSGELSSHVVDLNLDPDRMTVRVLTSKHAGNGKSRYVKHLIPKSRKTYKVITRIKSPVVDLDAEIFKLIENQTKNSDCAQVYHIDIAYEVYNIQ